MRTSALLILFFAARGASLAQCATDHIGVYTVRGCTAPDVPASYLFMTEAQMRGEAQLLLINFAGMPNSLIGCEDTLLVDLDCDAQTLDVQQVTYPVSGGFLTYAGTGTLYNDSIRIEFMQWNPNGSQEFCLLYKWIGFMGLEPGPMAARLVAYPNPAHEQLVVDGVSATGNATLINGSGRSCRMMQLHAGRNVIAVADLPSGPYLLRLASGEVLRFTRE